MPSRSYYVIRYDEKEHVKEQNELAQMVFFEENLNPKRVSKLHGP